jgi:putative phosphoesterase
LTAAASSAKLHDMEVIVLSDSHLRGGLDGIGAQVLDAVGNADVVLHAGDITSRQALAELETMTETYAVLGNNDHDLRGVLPESRLLELGGVRVALLHDSGATKGRAGRLFRRFPSAHIVVFGHSHIPINDGGNQGQYLFNPGSPTQRRSQPHRTFGRLRLFDGGIEGREIEVIR